MPWDSSDRRSRLPVNWHKLRATTKRLADGRCQWVTDGQRCIAEGTDCDHIVNNDDHSQANLQWLCRPHHDIKTAEETARGRRQHYGRGKHPAERHPGLA